MIPCCLFSCFFSNNYWLTVQFCNRGIRSRESGHCLNISSWAKWDPSSWAGKIKFCPKITHFLLPESNLMLENQFCCQNMIAWKFGICGPKPLPLFYSLYVFHSSNRDLRSHKEKSHSLLYSIELIPPLARYSDLFIPIQNWLQLCKQNLQTLMEILAGSK